MAKEPAKTKKAKEAAGRPGPAAKGREPEPEEPQGPYAPRLKELYRAQVVPALRKEFGYRNVMQVPRLGKIVVNMGLGEASQNIKILDSATRDLAALAGQKPVVTRARKSIAAFKLRTGMSVGAMVTLRGGRMYDFFDRLVNVTLPRVRDFKGVSPRGFDGRGNYTLGVREQVIFPEVDIDKVEKVKGMNITICTSARNDEEARALLQRLGMPFRQG
ncbi:MAG: 50S ribosomal protein L5 [Deltaproteobacteria bacterium]|nr:50S ribosomal protein L5 [Deltaproteobacteria bacterium]MBI3079441.1 50S ribosomal protein L5 [Deltaproteobacteria bacterium]